MFNEKVVLVTGGTKGIGRCIVEQFLEKGAIVAANYAHSESCAHDMEKALDNIYGEKFSLFKASVDEYSEVQTMVESIIMKYGKIDILVNNAGIEISKLMMQLSEKEWSNVLETNLTGTFLCCKSVLPYMMSQKNGRIINMSSVAANSGNIGQVAYAASKAGINALTKILAKEVARSGITVNAIAPGFVKTSMTEAFEEKYEKTVPLRRFGKTQEIADLVLFLASCNASYITGTISIIDGGLTL